MRDGRRCKRPFAVLRAAVALSALADRGRQAAQMVSNYNKASGRSFPRRAVAWNPFNTWEDGGSATYFGKTDEQLRRRKATREREADSFPDERAKDLKAKQPVHWKRDSNNQHIEHVGEQREGATKERKVATVDKVARQPALHWQTIDAIFGQMCGKENSTFKTEGTLDDSANKWAQQFVIRMNNTEMGTALLQKYTATGRVNVRRFFLEGEGDFAKHDFTQVLAASREGEVQPAGAADVTADGERDEATSAASDRSKWGSDETFHTYREKISHATRKHLQRSWLAQFTLQNEGPWCRTRFVIRQAAVAHLELSYLSGRFRTDRSPWPLELTPLCSIDGPVCAACSGSRDELR